VRLATFNILHGRSPADGRVDVDRLAAAIRALDVDVLALQEVDRDQPRSHLADLTEVASRAMGAVSHRFVAAIAGTPGATWMAATGKELPGTAAYGIALLSRFAARSWQAVRLPRLPGHLPMWLPGPGKFVIVHEEPRAALIGTLETPVGPLTVANTHLSYVPGWNRRQLTRLQRNLAPFPDPVVLMGDLNLTRPLRRSPGDWRALAAAPTFPFDAPTRQLDHILARGNLPAPVLSHAIAFDLSDHRALTVELTDAPSVG
jgi:endonuclease/exonuclease/phosphatase family metal-dependent hydrolase